MNSSILPSPRAAVPHARDERDVRAAWACVVVSPVAFLLAFVVGEGTSALLGYDGVGLAPWWIVTVALLLGAAVFCIPAALATWFWHRAQARGGDDRAKLPPSSSTCSRPRSSASTCWPTSSACSSRTSEAGTSEPTDEVPRRADRPASASACRGTSSERAAASVPAAGGRLALR